MPMLGVLAACAGWRYLFSREPPASESGGCVFPPAPLFRLVR